MLPFFLIFKLRGFKATFRHDEESSEIRPDGNTDIIATDSYQPL